MNGLRYALSVLTLAALAGGYAGSQLSFFRGTPPIAWPGMKAASAGLLLAAVALALWPAKEPEP